MIRQMLSSDIDRVHEIAIFSLNELYEKEVFWFFMSGWPAGQLVAVNEVGEIIGFLSGARLTADKVTIPMFAVDRNHRNKGVGSKLFEELRMRSMMDGKQYIQLEVGESSEEAVSFYRKHGFIVVDFLDRYYKDGTNAFRMIRSVYDISLPFHVVDRF